MATKHAHKQAAMSAEELEQFRAWFEAKCEPPLVRPGAKPVAVEEYEAWERWLMKRGLLAASPAPPPHAYAKLHNMLRRLWEQNLDQAVFIRGALATIAAAQKDNRQGSLL